MATKKKSARQTGRTTRKKDKQTTAKKPGWRKSADGNKYFENRANRSDKDRRKKL